MATSSTSGRTPFGKRKLSEADWGTSSAESFKSANENLVNSKHSAPPSVLASSTAEASTGSGSKSLLPPASMPPTRQTVRSLNPMAEEYDPPKADDTPVHKYIPAWRVHSLAPLPSQPTKPLDTPSPSEQPGQIGGAPKSSKPKYPLNWQPTTMNEYYEQLALAPEDRCPGFVEVQEPPSEGGSDYGPESESESSDYWSRSLKYGSSDEGDPMNIDERNADEPGHSPDTDKDVSSETLLDTNAQDITPVLDTTTKAEDDEDSAEASFDSAKAPADPVPEAKDPMEALQDLFSQLEVFDKRVDDFAQDVKVRAQGCQGLAKRVDKHAGKVEDIVTLEIPAIPVPVAEKDEDDVPAEDPASTVTQVGSVDTPSLPLSEYSDVSELDLNSVKDTVEDIDDPISPTFSPIKRFSRYSYQAHLATSRPDPYSEESDMADSSESLLGGAHETAEDYVKAFESGSDSGNASLGSLPLREPVVKPKSNIKPSDSSDIDEQNLSMDFEVLDIHSDPELDFPETGSGSPLQDGQELEKAAEEVGEREQHAEYEPLRSTAPVTPEVRPREILANLEDSPVLVTPPRRTEQVVDSLSASPDLVTPPRRTSADVDLTKSVAPTTPTPRRTLDHQVHRKYSCRLDRERGPLRTTSHGNLVEDDAETGEYILLDIPVIEDQSVLAKDKGKGKSAIMPRIATIPEAKNGATVNDDPRKRKPWTRVIKNVLTGSNRLPQPKKAPAYDPFAVLTSDEARVILQKEGYTAYNASTLGSKSDKPKPTSNIAGPATIYEQTKYRMTKRQREHAKLEAEFPGMFELDPEYKDDDDEDHDDLLEESGMIVESVYKETNDMTDYDELLEETGEIMESVYVPPKDESVDGDAEQAAGVSYDNESENPLQAQMTYVKECLEEAEAKKKRIQHFREQADGTPLSVGDVEGALKEALEE